ncbi:hypothetical protein Tco_1368890 [Tanacetum coccineum]
MKKPSCNDHEYVNCPLRFDDRIRPANLLPIQYVRLLMWISLARIGSYRMSNPVENEGVKGTVTEMFWRMALLRPSGFTVGCTGSIIDKKKDGSMPCVLIPQLNRITIRNRYPLLRIDDLI